MNSKTKTVATCCTLAVGVGLWGGMAQKFQADDRFAYEPNVACMKGSPYGKILALAMQGPIDFYWHNGTTHEHAEHLNGDHGHSHDHHGHGHDHHGHDHHGHDHGHGHDHHDHHGHDHHGHDHHDSQVAGNQNPTKKGQPFHKKAKTKIKMMSAMAHRKTDGKPMSKAHRAYIQGVTEDKLRLAYELDPSNYTNYNNYHLFIASTTFGKAEADDDAAVALAQRTIEYCQQDEMDPASWVTAASAAYNVIYHIGRYYQNYTVQEAKASLAEFDACIRRYVELRNESLEAGRVVSKARIDQMEEHVRYLLTLRKAQGVYMKRMMSTKMAKATAMKE